MNGFAALPLTIQPAHVSPRSSVTSGARSVWSMCASSRSRFLRFFSFFSFRSFSSRLLLRCFSSATCRSFAVGGGAWTSPDAFSAVHMLHLKQTRSQRICPHLGLTECLKLVRGFSACSTGPLFVAAGSWSALFTTLSGSGSIGRSNGTPRSSSSRPPRASGAAGSPTPRNKWWYVVGSDVLAIFASGGSSAKCRNRAPQSTLSGSTSKNEGRRPTHAV